MGSIDRHVSLPKTLPFSAALRPTTLVLTYIEQTGACKERKANLTIVRGTCPWHYPTPRPIALGSERRIVGVQAGPG